MPVTKGKLDFVPAALYTKLFRLGPFSLISSFFNAIGLQIRNIYLLVGTPPRRSLLQMVRLTVIAVLKLDGRFRALHMTFEATWTLQGTET